MRRWIATAAVLVALGGAARAAVPQQLSVQGILRDGAGALQSMTVQVTVKLFDVQTSGSAFYQAGPVGIMAQNGLFTLTANLLTADITALSNAAQVWLEVTVGNDVFDRQLVTPQMFALVAGSLACTGCVQSSMLASGIDAGKITGTVANADSAAKIQSTAVSSTAPSATGQVLVYNGTQWAPSLVSLTAGVSGVLPVANGGTGAATQNFVDLTANQAIAGNKNFTGAIGINTPTPLADLHITRATTPDIWLQWNDTSSSGVLGFLENGSFRGNLSYLGSTFATPERQNGLELTNTQTGHIAFRTGNIERMRLDENGNLGLGTTAPDQRLQIQFATGQGANIRMGNYSSIGEMFSAGYTVVGDNAIPTKTAAQMEVMTTHAAGYGARAIVLGGTLGITFHTMGGNVTAGDVFASERMRITNAGNVGIGTNNPQVALDVAGQVRLAKSSSAPFTCDANHDGSIALTNRYTMCVCKTNAWVSTTDGLTACVFN